MQHNAIKNASTYCQDQLQFSSTRSKIQFDPEITFPTTEGSQHLFSVILYQNISISELWSQNKYVKIEI